MSTRLNLNAADGTLAWDFDNVRLRGFAETGDLGTGTYTGTLPPRPGGIYRGTFTLMVNGKAVTLIMVDMDGEGYATYQGEGTTEGLAGEYLGEWTLTE
jgi:hypothetical protein